MERRVSKNTGHGILRNLAIVKRSREHDKEKSKNKGKHKDGDDGDKKEAEERNKGGRHHDKAQHSPSKPRDMTQEQVSQDSVQDQAASFLAAKEPSDPASIAASAPIDVLASTSQPPTSPPPAASGSQSTVPFQSIESIPAGNHTNPKGHAHDPRDSIALIAGATLAGIMLILILAGAIAYKCGTRKRAKANVKAKSSIVGGGADPLQSGPNQNVGGSEKTSSFDAVSGAHRESNAAWAPPSSSLESGQEQVSPPMLQQRMHRSLKLIPARFSGAPIQTGQHQEKPWSQTTPQESRRSRTLLQGGSRHTDTPLESIVPTQDGEKSPEGDDDQIDRCLSYYIKSNARASSRAPDLPSSMPVEFDHARALDRSDTQRYSKSIGKSLKFPKTVDLLKKIRRSQLRLDDEALSKAKQEGFRISRIVSDEADATLPGDQSFASASSRPCTIGTIQSKYDVSSSFVSVKTPTQSGRKIPAHWRSSSKVHKRAVEASEGGSDQDILGTSPAMSEPHSAFEYADYYDSYLPDPHASVTLHLSDNGTEDELAVPWQNQSPCRSSAISPRLSSITRQRSATSDPQPSSPWSAGANAEHGDDGVARPHRGKSHLSHMSNAYRESAEVDEVIRF